MNLGKVLFFRTQVRIDLIELLYGPVQLVKLAAAITFVRPCAEGNQTDKCRDRPCERVEEAEDRSQGFFRSA